MDEPVELHQTAPQTDRPIPSEVRLVNGIPIPAKPVAVSSEKAEAWIAEGVDDDMQEIRRKIVNSIDCVSYERFKGEVDTVVGRLNERLAQMDDPSAYGVLWGYKSHSSNTWVAALARENLAYPPAQEGYFMHSYEKPNGFPTLEALAAKGIRTVVSFDDAIYSGEQALKQLIRPIYDYNQAHKDQPPFKLILAVPFVSTMFLRQEIVQRAIAAGLIEIIYTQTIPTLKDQFSDNDQAILKAHGDILDDNVGVFYQAPATAFDHRVPDPHSFPEEAYGVLVSLPKKPYGVEGTDYYEEDETRYSAYQEPLMSAVLGHK